MIFLNQHKDSHDGHDAAYQPENSKARLYQNLMVTIPAQDSQAGVVKSVDANGQLVVSLGALNGSNHLELSGGTTLLVRNGFGYLCRRHLLWATATARSFLY